jgi:hypothetical protein
MAVALEEAGDSRVAVIDEECLRVEAAGNRSTQVFIPASSAPLQCSQEIGIPERTAAVFRGTGTGIGLADGIGGERPFLVVACYGFRAPAVVEIVIIEQPASRHRKQMADPRRSFIARTALYSTLRIGIHASVCAKPMQMSVPPSHNRLDYAVHSV